MPLGTATITYDLADLIGADFDARRTKVWVTTNVPSETVVDTGANKIRLGSGNGSIAEDGTGSVAVWTPGTGANPASWQTYIHVAYPDRNTPRGRARRTFGPFTITAPADLADLVEQQEVPPEYIVTVTSALSPLVGSAQAAATTAAASATSAAASAAAAQTIVLADADGAMAAAVNDPTSDVKAALAATFAGLDTLAPFTRLQRAVRTIIATWQNGHGWVDMGGTAGGSAGDDTVDFRIGTRSYKVVTPAAAGAARTVRKTGLTAVNLTGKNFAVYLKVDQPTALGDIILTVGDDAFTNFTQYRAVHGNATAVFATLRPNVWQWVHFTKAEQVATAGTGGLTAVTAWQLRVNGGATSAITVHFNAIGYFTPASSFPNGVVSFTFDDSHQRQHELAAQLLSQRGMPATAFIIAELTNSPNYLSYDQLDDLHGTHGWEIGGHAYSVANHNAGFATLTDAQRDEDLKNLRAYLARGGWRGADLFAYPLSSENEATNDSVGRYFSFARLVTRKPYQPTRLDNGMRVRSYSVDSAATTAATVTALIDDAYANGWWLILTLHDIKGSGSTLATEWDYANLATVADYCITKGIPVRTVGEVVTAP